MTYSDPASMAIAQRILSIPGKRVSKRVVSYLRQDQLDALLAAPDRTTLQGRRDYGLLLFLARTGARVSEAVAVNSGDLRFDSPTQVLLHGKGRKDRILPLAPDIIAVLRALIAERPEIKAGAPVFINARGRRLTRFGVIHIVDRAAAAASKTVPDLAKRSVSPHQLRHTTAMHLLQAGVDLTTIASWLGHASVDTTHHYVEADLEMKSRALAKCDQPEAVPSRFKPTDELLAMLERL